LTKNNIEYSLKIINQKETKSSNQFILTVLPNTIHEMKMLLF